MILIITSEKDTSTNHIIDWLIFYGIDFKRINGEDRFTLSSFELSNDRFKCKLVNTRDDDILDLNKISAVWYRRGDIVILNKGKQKSDFAGILSFIRQEYQILHDYIMTYFEGLPRLDSYFRRSVNKITVLSLARSVGLLIPTTYLFDGHFPRQLSGSYISKSVFEVFNYETSEGYFSTPTTLIDADTISRKEHSYSLSKVQKHIEKECDIRIFYLRGRLYGMAIMSQKNEISKVDFRHYPSDPPNRSFPVQIPSEIADKLGKLMNRLNLDSGSIDLILDNKGSFYFLEVNPVGQFGMTSGPCNYYLERGIARDLIQYEQFAT
jgi:ATP-GRASP peptide maturase of grasp-with-spasm system